MERMKRIRLFGLPPAKGAGAATGAGGAGGGGGAAGGGGGGGGGGSPKNISKKKIARSRYVDVVLFYRPSPYRKRCFEALGWTGPVYVHANHGLGKVLETTKMNKKRHASRGRLAAGRAQEEFEQAVKGGFERIFPPSQSAPNARANYTKVLALALSRQSTVVIGVFVPPLDRL